GTIFHHVIGLLHVYSREGLTWVFRRHLGCPPVSIVALWFHDWQTRRCLYHARREETMADETQIAELSQKMISEREKLLSALESLSEDEAAQSPMDGEWTAKQQMSHLCEMETAYRAWVARALEEDGANVE